MLQTNFWYELPSILIKLIEGSSELENEALQNLNLSLNDIHHKIEFTVNNLNKLIDNVNEKEATKFPIQNFENIESLLKIITVMIINTKCDTLKMKLKKLNEAIMSFMISKGKLCCESIKLTIDLFNKFYEEILNFNLKNVDILTKIQYFLKILRITIDKANNEIYSKNTSTNCQKLFVMLKVLCEKYQIKLMKYSEIKLNSNYLNFNGTIEEIKLSTN